MKMLTYMKKISMLLATLSLMLLPVFVSQAAAASFDIPNTTLTISKLGDLTLVVKDGVPQTIVVRGRDVSGSNISFSVNGIPYMGDVSLSNNLTLQPGTMPLMFDHYGKLCFTVGGNVLVLEYKGTATKTVDLMKLTKTLYSAGDFVVAEGTTGQFAGLKGMMGTYKLNEVCHIVAGEHPKVGSPVEVTFSAM
jgi:hypothetical protein